MADPWVFCAVVKTWLLGTHGGGSESQKAVRTVTASSPLNFTNILCQ